MQGIRACWRHEAAFRQEASLAIVGVPLALWLARDGIEFLLLVLPLFLLMLAELANSAIEAIVDRLGHEADELSGRAKDMGSAVVFMAIMIAGLSWCTILGTRFLSL
jgi:diacylglycerol kinase (ATP)